MWQNDKYINSFALSATSLFISSTSEAFLKGFVFEKLKQLWEKIGMLLNSLPNDKIWDLIKTEAFADDKLDIAEMEISVFDWIQKLRRKLRKCWFTAFSSFPTIFSTGFFFRIIISQDLCHKWIISKVIVLQNFLKIRLSTLTLSQTTNFGLFQTKSVCRRQLRQWQKVLQMGTKQCGKSRICL